MYQLLLIWEVHCVCFTVEISCSFIFLIYSRCNLKCTQSEKKKTTNPIKSVLFLTNNSMKSSPIHPPDIFGDRKWSKGFSRICEARNVGWRERHQAPLLMYLISCRLNFLQTPEYLWLSNGRRSTGVRVAHKVDYAGIVVKICVTNCKL